MGYGDTYSRKPRQSTKEEISEKNSLVSCLCNDAGYNREYLENIELEAKIDLSYSSRSRKTGIILTFGEDLSFQEPYSRDKILPSSEARHSCYAFVDKKEKQLQYAFTKIESGERVKIKIKGKTQQINRGGIVLLRRAEKHLEDLSAIEVNKYIAKTARQSKLPLEYVGSFSKQSKEAFVFNPTSGRIFVVATNICGIQSNPNKLYQLEAEYYGQINGFSSTRGADEDLAELVKGMINNFPKGYSGNSSTLTKFDWLVRNRGELSSFKKNKIVTKLDWLVRMFGN